MTKNEFAAKPPAKVLSTLALKGVLEQTAQEFERVAGHKLAIRFDATNALLKAIEAGESADLVILTAEAMAELAKRGLVLRGVPLGSSGVGVAVRSGAPKPDISSVEALKAALLAAESVARSEVGASGIYFAGVLERLGIAERLKKIVIVQKGPVGAVVASGGAAIGVQQLCELAPVKGIDIVGPLPGALQKVTVFSAGVMATAARPDAAAALIDFLRSDAASAAMEKNGMVPAMP
jgi:molybdate transport system substrate-binding protein